MALRHIALISETIRVNISQLAMASAAIQKQVMRDFAPIWGEQATVDVIPDLENLPNDYWAVIVRDDIGEPGAAGIHREKSTGEPFGLVQFSNTWRLIASHEILEMLVDPHGKRFERADSIISEQGQVDYLVEVCDPSEAFQFGYQVNGIQLSDFYTPEYFSSTDVSGVRYSFSGAITEPLQVLRDGYLSWQEPATERWFQLKDKSGVRKILDLGFIHPLNGDFRSEIDRRVDISEKVHGIPEGDARLQSQSTRSITTENNRVDRAKDLRRQIEELKAQSPAP